MKVEIPKPLSVSQYHVKQYSILAIWSIQLVSSAELEALLQASYSIHLRPYWSYYDDNINQYQNLSLARATSSTSY